MDWHAYITSSPLERFRNTEDHIKYLDLLECSRRSYAISFGDLRHKNVPKKVIKERTRDFLVRAGYPPFSFRFQCLTTGRRSRLIKRDEYHLFGISVQDTKDGGEYLEFSKIKNKMQPIRDDVQARLKEIHTKAFGSRDSWWKRYTEYLQSEDWHNIRRKIIARDAGRCVLTLIKENLQVHHLHYKNVGKENQWDLITVCKESHAIIHNPEDPQCCEFQDRLKEIAEDMKNHLHPSW